jgi:hypothetical protein
LRALRCGVRQLLRQALAIALNRCGCPFAVCDLLAQATGLGFAGFQRQHVFRAKLRAALAPLRGPDSDEA